MNITSYGVTYCLERDKDLVAFAHAETAEERAKVLAPLIIHPKTPYQRVLAALKQSA